MASELPLTVERETFLIDHAPSLVATVRLTALAEPVSLEIGDRLARIYDADRESTLDALGALSNASIASDYEIDSALEIAEEFIHDAVRIGRLPATAGETAFTGTFTLDDAALRAWRAAFDAPIPVPDSALGDALSQLRELSSWDRIDSDLTRLAEEERPWVSMAEVPPGARLGNWLFEDRRCVIVVDGDHDIADEAWHVTCVGADAAFNDVCDRIEAALDAR